MKFIAATAASLSLLIGLNVPVQAARCMEDQALWAQGAIAYETQIAGLPRGGW